MECDYRFDLHEQGVIHTVEEGSITKTRDCTKLLYAAKVSTTTIHIVDHLDASTPSSIFSLTSYFTARTILLSRPVYDNNTIFSLLERAILSIFVLRSSNSSSFLCHRFSFPAEMMNTLSSGMMSGSLYCVAIGLDLCF